MRRIIAAVRPKEIPNDAIVMDFGKGQIWCDGRLIGRGKNTIMFKVRCAFIIACQSGSITHAEMFDYVWSDDDDGGPAAPENYLKTRLAVPREQRVFERLGIKITTRWGLGYFVTQNKSPLQSASAMAA